MSNKPSKRQERRLYKALASVVLTDFPNPERTDCPGMEVLHAIATKRISMRDPAIEHVGQCSPCYAELTKIRQALHRRKVLRASGTGASVVVLAVLVTYFAFRRVDNQIQDQVARPGVEARTPAAVSPAPQGDSVPPAVSPQQPRPETALLDLRKASVTRSLEPPGPTSRQPVEIARGLLALTIQLPIGSDAGAYEIEIRKPNQPAIRVAKGQARIEDGITKLSINVDTNSIEPGDYEIRWRLAGWDWRDYPIFIR